MHNRPAHRRGFVAAVALLGISLAADAHRAPGSLTTIGWNSRSGTTEIVHRLHTHDAELGVGEILGIPDLSVETLEGRAQIALYAEERFRIAGEDGELPLDLVGAELAGDYLLVYQEYAGRLPARIQVRDDLLRDVFAAQVNQVNVEDGDTVRSLVFAGDDGWQTYLFGE
jgi:hypothetical protein